MGGKYRIDGEPNPAFTGDVKGISITINNSQTETNARATGLKPDKTDSETYNTLPRDCPYDHAGWISKLTFWWLFSVVKRIRDNKFTGKDQFKFSKNSGKDSAGLTLQLDKQWQTEAAKEHPSLFRAAARAFWKDLAIMAPLTLVLVAILLSQPVFIGHIVNFLLGKPGTNSTTAMLFAGGIVGISVMFCFINSVLFYNSYQLGMKLRTALTGVIYHKALSMDSQTRQYTSNGRIINMMSADLEVIVQCFIAVPCLIMTPLASVAVLILIWQDFGSVALVGAFLFLVMIFINLLIGKCIGRIRAQTALRTDNRVNMMNEVIIGMSVIKMYCWEKPYTAIVNRMRRREIRTMFRSLVMHGLVLAGSRFTGRLAAYLVLVSATFVGIHLPADKVVKLIGWLEVLQQQMSGFVVCLGDVMESITSLARIQAYLKLETKCIPDDEAHQTDDHIAVLMTNLTTVWEVPDRKSLGISKKQANYRETINNNAHRLRCGSASIMKGELVIIAGPVGAGKTSLLMSLLGEMTKIEGKLSPLLSVAYTPQQPWIMSTTVRENILFGSEYVKEKYLKVLRACDLEKDIGEFAAGDSTLIGERGLTLSGGQKARVSLARAIYQDNDVFLLDDPLSAVDSLVGRHIFTEAICGYLKRKTRILVTHQLKYVDKADTVIFMNNSCLQLIGKPSNEEIKCAVGELMSEIRLKDTQIKDDDQMIIEVDHSLKNNQVATWNVREEFGETGAVSWNVYWKYCTAGRGHCWLVLYMLFALPSQVFAVVSDWWLSIWVKFDDDYYLNTTASNSTASAGEDSSYVHLKIYSVFIWLMISFGLVKQIFLFTFTTTASKYLHDSMFRYVVGAPLAFFETNPVGIILNRFARDIGIIDNHLAKIGSFAISEMLNILSFLVFVLAVNPYTMIAAIPYVTAIFLVRRFVLSAGRELKRLEAICRSPVYSHTSTTLDGHVVIRAFRKEEQFVRQFHEIQDRHTMAWFLFISCYRGLGLWIGFLSTIYMAAILLAAFLTKSQFGTLIGLALVHTFILVDSLQYLTSISTEFENMMTSVERVGSYTKLQQESTSSGIKVPKAWPSRGVISFKDVSMSYSEGGENVLNNISFKVKSEEKIGILGRTGAGKSSIFKALLRLVEPEGVISIDDIDSSQVSLTDLRKNISVIPQDPILFRGTVRDNLDPFDEFDDDHLWMCLEQVQLKEVVTNMPKGLSCFVGESGNLFSLGQKQLMCLARAMLRNNKILIIDEATANVDHRTDDVIQKAIRKAFRYCTILTIAHRINTISDSDKFLVIEKGTVKMFGSKEDFNQTLVGNME